MTVARHRGHRLVPAVRTLRELRVDQGLSLLDMERRCGVNRGILSQIERGRMVGNADELARIASALGLDRLENRLVPVHEDRAE